MSTPTTNKVISFLGRLMVENGGDDHKLSVCALTALPRKLSLP
ncbi:MAG: hypothetical protein RSE07_06810 [Oscillospiraceae bacterium]